MFDKPDANEFANNRQSLFRSLIASSELGCDCHNAEMSVTLASWLAGVSVRPCITRGSFNINKYKKYIYFFTK